MVNVTCLLYYSRTRLGELNEDEVYKQVIALLGPYSDRKWREAVLAACHAVTNLMFENDKVDPDKQGQLTSYMPQPMPTLTPCLAHPHPMPSPLSPHAQTTHPMLTPHLPHAPIPSLPPHS